MVLTCCSTCKKWSWPQFPRPGQWPKSGQFLWTAYCKMTIFRRLAARSPQRPPGQARRNKILADSADDPDDADEADDLDESDNANDSDDSLMTSWASCPSCTKCWQLNPPINKIKQSTKRTATSSRRTTQNFMAVCNQAACV